MLTKEYLGVDVGEMEVDGLYRLLDEIEHSRRNMAISRDVRAGMLVEVKMEIIKRGRVD